MTKENTNNRDEFFKFAQEISKKRTMLTHGEYASIVDSKYMIEALIKEPLLFKKVSDYSLKFDEVYLDPIQTPELMILIIHYPEIIDNAPAFDFWEYFTLAQLFEMAKRNEKVCELLRKFKIELSNEMTYELIKTYKDNPNLIAKLCSSGSISNFAIVEILLKEPELIEAFKIANVSLSSSEQMRLLQSDIKLMDSSVINMGALTGTNWFELLMKNSQEVLLKAKEYHIAHLLSKPQLEGVLTVYKDTSLDELLY